MSDSNHHTRTVTPSKHHPSIPTKSQIMLWIYSLLPTQARNFTIESLGNGAIYCKIINHYCPGTILPSRIISNPINEYESCLNLKQLQLGLARMKIQIPLDINKVSKQRFTENWNLITLLYRHLEGFEVRKALEDNFTIKRCPPQLPHYPKQSVLFENQNKVNENISLSSMKQEIFPRGGLIHIVDRVKEILISNSNDAYKIQLIGTLFGVAEEVKKEEPEEVFESLMLDKKDMT